MACSRGHLLRETDDSCPALNSFNAIYVSLLAPVCLTAIRFHEIRERSGGTGETAL